MRRGTKPKLLMSANSQVIGVDMSSDFTAEHEWGIKKIREAFGMSLKAKAGVDRRTITDVPETLAWVQDGKNAGFAYRPWWITTGGASTAEQITKRVVNHDELRES